MRFDPRLERRGRMLEPREASKSNGETETEQDSWRSLGERGTVAGIRSLIVAATAFGRPIARVIVYFVALYYTLTSPPARRAVNALRTQLGLPLGFRHTFRHVRRFAQVTLDALFFLRGKLSPFRIERTGRHHLKTLREQGQSAVLLGAHLGSFYAMRGMSADEKLPLSPVVYTKNARRINALLEQLDPTSTTRLVEIGDGGQVDFMLAIRERAEAGGLVAILADRVPPDGRSVTVNFLGAEVELPQGPFLVAASLRIPVYFTVGLYLGGSHYSLHCRPFADKITLPRGARAEAIGRYAQQYAHLLEEFVKMAPENWFNFYDFFPNASDGASPHSAEQAEMTSTPHRNLPQ